MREGWSFKKDKWREDEPLFESFPSLYALAISNEAYVVDLWDQTSERD